MRTARFQTSAFIFRRDLRLEDNTGLLNALARSKEVIAVFIFDPRQVKDNPYRSDAAVRFMMHSLRDLDRSLQNRGGRLHCFNGTPRDVVKQLIRDQGVQAVFLNRDYTPFSQQRDFDLKHQCDAAGVAFHSYDDALLYDPDGVRKADGGVYTVYTPFMKKARELPVSKPRRNPFGHFVGKRLPSALNKVPDDSGLSSFQDLRVKGGRGEALRLLRKMRDLGDYDRQRDFPAKDATTHLSAHLKFGTVSAREVYHRMAEAFGEDHALIRELTWRDFFVQVGFHHPHVLGSAFLAKYDRIPWRTDNKQFAKWCEGLTGFPIVDAGMRELNQTGYMHNRVRMITASFLVKDLHIDWRWGEKYFAQKLVDYDPLVNNGNWQWAASTGCDAQPYFRIFNPWRQQEKFDPRAEYIRRWVPELAEITAKDIHNLENTRKGHDGYPPPMVNHRQASLNAKEMFRRLK